MIEASGLTKQFDAFEAVRGIDFEVRPGEAFGLLGPNGAGKSTTMRMIACVSPRTGGVLRVLGLDPDRDGPAIRARLGVVPQENNLDNDLSVLQNLVQYARYFGMSKKDALARAKDLVSFAKLTDRAEDKVEPLSGGMRRRLAVARALVNDPDLLLLDEPTTGLDPQVRHALWDRLRDLKERGVTLVLTTHYMDEAEQLCDRIVIMENGMVVAEGGPRELIARHSTREVVELRLEHFDRQTAAKRLAGVGERQEHLADRVLIYTGDGESALAQVHARELHPVSSLVRRSTLEDVFLSLTGRALSD